MKIYTLESKFTFGKFNNKTLHEAASLQPQYIDWCLLNLDHFLISIETYHEIQQVYPTFQISQDALSMLTSKSNIYYEEVKEKQRSFNSNNGDWSNDSDPTDWSHYNDELDADQQSEDFWNQF